MSSNVVLVVEDDKDIRTNLSQALQMEGYSVLEAADGIEALTVLAALIQDRLPCCILLDIQMPRMTGDELFRVVEKYCGNRK